MLMREWLIAPPVRSLSISPRAAGPLVMLSSAFLFAVLDVLIKFLDSSFRVWDIAFYRFGCGMIVLIAVFGRTGNPFNGHNRKLLILRGITGSMAFLALVAAIRLIPISTALVLFYAFPAFAALFSVLLFQERIKKTELLCVVTALSGVAVLLDFNMKGAVPGQIISLIGAGFAGLAVAIIKKLREDNGPVVIYLYFCLLGAAISFVPFVMNPRLPHSSIEWLMIAGIVFTSLAAQLLMNQGLRYCRSWEGGIFLTTEVILTSILGIFFLHEAVSWHFIVGAALILGSIIALSHGDKQRISHGGIASAGE